MFRIKHSCLIHTTFIEWIGEVFFTSFLTASLPGGPRCYYVVVFLEVITVTPGFSSNISTVKWYITMVSSSTNPSGRWRWQYYWRSSWSKWPIISWFQTGYGSGRQCGSTTAEKAFPPCPEIILECIFGNMEYHFRVNKIRYFFA